MKTYKTLLILFAALLTGCVRDDLIGPAPPPDNGTAEISFLAETPPSVQVSTRAQTGTIPENTIRDIYVLVFDKSTGTLRYKSRGKSLATGSGSVNNNKWTFKATLPVGTGYTFMVLANAEDKLAGIEVGLSPAKTKADVLALTVTETDKWDLSSRAIPMWCEKDLNLTASDSPIFEMTRMLARVNVEVNLREIGGQAVDNFDLTSIRLYHYNTVGALVPEAGNYNPATQTTLAPTIPAAPGNTTGPILYTGSHITDNACKGKIYAFEARHNGHTYTDPANNTEWIENACLVIGGKYTTPEGIQLDETFYRIDFIRKQETGSGTEEIWLSLLRNFSYNVTIVQVDGSGFTTPDDALRSAPINMEAKILEWNDTEMGEIAFDGTFFLSVSRDEFTVGSAAVNQEEETNILYVKTDYVYNNDPGHGNSGWYVEKYVDATTGDPVNWLTLHPERAAPDAVNKVKTHFTYEENNSGKLRTAVIWLAAGRLRYPVYVTQRLARIEILDPANGYLPLDELVFEVPTEGTGVQVKNFEVRWGPTDAAVSIQQTSPVDWAPFEPGWITPNPSPSWTLSDPQGKKLHEVRPPAVSSDMIVQDPFYEKVSTYAFTVGSGDMAETASIRLQQIHYHIAVDVHDYKLDGGSYYLTVRSNTEWEIESIEEWLRNVEPTGNESLPVLLNLRSSDRLKVGATGGPDRAGEPVYFSTVNQRLPAHENKWGTVYVTFKSPSGKFDPVTVAIKFAPINDDEFTILGLGYANDFRNYNTAYSWSWTQQGLNRMINSKYNFGSYPESTVQAGNINTVGYNCEGLPGPNRPAPGYRDNWAVGSFREWLNQHNPDMITIAYSMRFTDSDEELLIKYLDRGGVVIMHYGELTIQVLTDVRKFLQRLFGGIDLSGKIIEIPIANNGSVFQLPDGDEWANDPILNGPFGDMRGGYYGMNLAYYSVDLSEVSNQFVDYTGTIINKATPHNKTTFFRHKTRNIFFIANGGGSGSGYPGQGSQYPHYDVNRNEEVYFRPILREGFGPSAPANAPKYDVCNAIIYMNAIAWGLNVSNHVPPEGGY